MQEMYQNLGDSASRASSKRGPTEGELWFEFSSYFKDTLGGVPIIVTRKRGGMCPQIWCCYQHASRQAGLWECSEAAFVDLLHHMGHSASGKLRQQKSLMEYVRTNVGDRHKGLGVQCFEEEEWSDMMDRVPPGGPPLQGRRGEGLRPLQRSDRRVGRLRRHSRRRAMMYRSNLGGTVVEGAIGGPPAASAGSLSTLSEVTKWIRIADTYPPHFYCGHFETKDKPVYLDVPYEDRMRCKNMGGRWDTEHKQWFVPSTVDVAPFLRVWKTKAPL